MVAQTLYTSVQVPWPRVRYCSTGAKPSFMARVMGWPEEASRALPKSIRRMVPSESIMMLSGLTSRWISPVSCTWPRARMMGAMAGSSTSGGMRPPKPAAICFRFLPSRYSMTR